MADTYNFNENVTYAYFDIINTRKILLSHDGALRFKKMWHDADMWITHNPYGYYRSKRGFKEPVNLCVRAFSDSLLLLTRPELEIDDFYVIVNKFREIIDKQKFDYYCIINCDREIIQSDIPASGGFRLNDKNQPIYMQVCGLGPAWINIYETEKAIKECPKWYSRYRLYCIGEQSKPHNVKEEECMGVIGYDGARLKIYALKWVNFHIENRHIEGSQK